jgi:hypothetical protein
MDVKTIEYYSFEFCKIFISNVCELYTEFQNSLNFGGFTQRRFNLVIYTPPRTFPGRGGGWGLYVPFLYLTPTIKSLLCIPEWMYRFPAGKSHSPSNPEPAEKKVTEQYITIYLSSITENFNIEQVTSFQHSTVKIKSQF